MWPRRSHLLTPLSNLTGNTKFGWTPDCQQAFDTMKSILATDVMLAYPNHNLPFEIFLMQVTTRWAQQFYNKVRRWLTGPANSPTPKRTGKRALGSGNVSQRIQDDAYGSQNNCIYGPQKFSISNFESPTGLSMENVSHVLCPGL